MAWLAGESDQDSDMARVFAAMDAELGQSAALERLPDGDGGGARQALQEALELAQNGIRVHQAAEEPSVLGIQNCQTLIHEIKQRRNQGT